MGNVVHSTYTTGTRALPDIYARALGPAALGLVHIYQAKHSSLWYKYNIYARIMIMAVYCYNVNYTTINSIKKNYIIATHACTSLISYCCREWF